MKETAKLSLQNDYSAIKHAIAFLSSLLTDFTFAEKEKMKICIALEEALFHTFKSSLEMTEAVFTDIIFYKSAGTFEISILNRGVPYEMDDAEFDMDTLGENEDALSGYVMKKAVDSVIYRNMGKNGQEIRLVKYLETLKDYSGQTGEAGGTVAEKPEIHVRAIKPEEVIEITRCVYDEYKYSYPNEDIYYPERVVSMLGEKKLFSFVSVTDKEEIAGHTALKYCPEYPALMDTAIWVVKQKFRGFSIMKNLLPHSLERAKGLDINGVFIEAVTHHPATQKVSKRYGFYATGFYLLHTSPSTVVNYETGGGRRSLAIAYKPYRRIEKAELYVPEIHREHIREMYGRLGTEAVFMPCPEKPDLLSKSELTVNQAMWNLFAVVEINACGTDLEAALKGEIKRMKQNGIEVVMIRANMDDENCSFIYEIALKCGFFYTGFVPHTGNGNVMLLHNLMGRAVKYESTNVIEDYSEVLDYIRKFDSNEKE